MTSYFNPRTREGCDLDAGRLVPFYIDISIHAPVKGATFDLDVDAGLRGVISIHAPVKGATTVCKNHAMVQQDFNPRTREGCDASR